MKILLDTTYLLPLIGISIEEIPDEMILELINRGYKLFINYVTLFELAAKGAKYISMGKLSLERVVKGIIAIVHDERVVKINIESFDTLYTSFKLRRYLRDYIDCLIVATALHYCDILLTEDDTLLKISESTWFKEIKERLNPELKVMNYKTFKRNQELS